MAVKSSSSVMLLFFALLFSYYFGEFSAALGGGGGRKGALAGGWEPIKDLKDKYVVDIAKFAVDEHNKEINAQLEFQSILKGEQQVVSGMNYKLTLAAKDGDNVNQYEAVVYDKPWEHLRNLTSFKQVS